LVVSGGQVAIHPETTVAWRLDLERRRMVMQLGKDVLDYFLIPCSFIGLGTHHLM
jgi:hypothetical protein